MPIHAKAFQNPAEVLNLLVLILLIVMSLYVLGAALRATWASAGLGARLALRPHPRVRRTPLPVLGFLVALSTHAPAQRRVAVIPSRDAGSAAAPPWSATSGFPPPRPLVRIGGPASRHATGPAQTALDPDAAPEGDARGGHRALHPGRGNRGTVTSLFPRERRYDGRKDAERAERERSMARHPSGRHDPCSSASERYVVRAGDTLWDIAATLLGTEDGARVARYWPRIHRRNRDVIGPDPSLIFPGMVLTLPAECDS